MNKISKIESLSVSDLKIAFIQLLGKMNFSDVVDQGTYIMAQTETSLSVIKHLFVFPDKRMSGNDILDPIVSLIKSISEIETYDTITVVSQFHISKGFQDSLNTKISGLKYIGRDNLLKLIDDHNDIFWRHDDVELLGYEQQFREIIRSENQMKKLHLTSDKFDKLVNLYIQPTLLTDEEDLKTHTLHRKRVALEELVADKTCAFISGMSGAGKSTMLQKIGIQLLEQNDSKNGKKYLPIYLTSSDILASCRNVNDAILSKISSIRTYTKFHELTDAYEVVILIDSIDEFEDKDKKNILRVLLNNFENKKVRFFIASRYSSFDFDDKSLKGKVTEYSISKFNYEQIKRYVYSLLPNQDKANTLMESLRENKILEKLPITPLTLSLITIIYDEQDYEVPATITDIYRQFNTIINGRATVSTKFDYIDINFRERILSIYALHLMEKPNHYTMTRGQFVNFFKAFYDGKSLSFDYEQLDDVLSYILDNTGILYVNGDGKVCFAHDSYMEFYAAIEIFNYHREKETVLVENFFDVMWQNCAIFYAGMTKDMEVFAREINKKLKQSSKFMEYISGVQGAGYLTQALYMTDNIVRKDIILTALEMVLETNEFFKKMTTINKNMLQNFRLPVVH